MSKFGSGRNPNPSFFSEIYGSVVKGAVGGAVGGGIVGSVLPGGGTVTGIIGGAAVGIFSGVAIGVKRYGVKKWNHHSPSDISDCPDE